MKKLVVLAFLARINIYELMFHPLIHPSFTLAREVKLLGALLGQVVTEQSGPELLDLVERVRRRSIELRRTGATAEGATDPVHTERRAALARELDGLEPRAAEGLIQAFALYFQLANLAEEKQRVRRLRRRGLAGDFGCGSRGTAPQHFKAIAPRRSRR